MESGKGFILWAWFRFLVFSSCLFLAGFLSCKFALDISGRTRLSERFMGAFFLAVATSLPEVLTSSIAVYKGFFDLGVGDIFGSLLINLLILISLDLFPSKGNYLRAGLKSEKLYFILLIQFTAITALALRLKFKSSLSSFGFGFENFLILVLYLLYLRRERGAEITQRRDLRSPLTSWIYFGVCLIGISVFGRLLIKEANIIVENTRLNYVFFGTLFFALVTSLPELTVTISALLHGSSSMAIGNILGSNAMDISILPVLDLITREMPILGLISRVNLFTLVAIEFVTLGLFGIMKVKKEFLRAYEVLLVLLLLAPLFILY